MPPTLDHIIILLPYSDLINPPSWWTKDFTITPGGQHAGGKTENKLICFRDGSYIELIAFVNDDPKHREGHWWGKKSFGIIDFALSHPTGDAAVHFSELESRLQTLNAGDDAPVPKVEYQPPIAGGRKRPDGVDVKWNVTFPIVDTGYQRGELPFFCHDVTPRSLRVPFSEESVTHPNGAEGIKQLGVFVLEERVKGLVKIYEAVLGIENTGGREEGKGCFLVEPLRKGEGSGNQNTEICLQTPSEEWKIGKVKERGGLFLADLTFYLKGHSE